MYVATDTIMHETLANLANHQSAFPKINTQLPLLDHSSNFSPP